MVRRASSTGGRLMLPETITDFVVEELRNRIVLGILQPGQKVPVYELANELGVSRVPLREAVRQLEAESLVDNLPRRGTVVRDLNEQDLRDSFELLEAIETMAARRAASSTSEDVASCMQYWLGEMQRLAKRRDNAASPEMLNAHREFHFALFRGAGEGGVLDRHLRTLWNACERYLIISADDGRRSRAAAEHAGLVDLIASGDPETTVEALRAHLHDSLATALRYLSSQKQGAGTASPRVP